MGLNVEIKLFFQEVPWFVLLFSLPICLTMYAKYKRKLAADNLPLCQEFLICGVLKRPDSTVRQRFVEFYVHRRCNISSSVEKSGKFSQLSESAVFVQLRARCYLHFRKLQILLWNCSSYTKSKGDNVGPGFSKPD